MVFHPGRRPGRGNEVPDRLRRAIAAHDVCGQVARRHQSRETLSRLNRAHPEKHDVFVLDFQNHETTGSDYSAPLQTDPDKSPQPPPGTRTPRAKSLTHLCGYATAPAPFGPIPADRQLRWHQMEFYGFLHFTVNTFTDKEWGLGDSRRLCSPQQTLTRTRSSRQPPTAAWPLDPDLQAPRRLLPLAFTLHSAFRQEQPLAERQGGCGAGDRRCLCGAWAEIWRLSLALGSQPRRLRTDGLHPLLP